MDGDAWVEVSIPEVPQLKSGTEVTRWYAGPGTWNRAEGGGEQQ